MSKDNRQTQGNLIITGGTRGIGKAVLDLAIERGYRIVAGYLSSVEKALELENTHNTKDRAVLKMVRSDVSKSDEVRKLFEEADKFFGIPDGLVNNAGILETQMPFEKQDRGRWERVINTNILGTMECCKEAIARMAVDNGGQGGSIVNLSSMAAYLGSPFEYVDYATSKGAVDTLTIGLSKEVAAQGIRVNSVQPGIIETEIHASGGMPDRPKRLADTIPMKRPGSAHEVATTILWLLSSEASYVTGARLCVGGGR